MPDNRDHEAAIALTYDGANAPTVSGTGQDELAREMIRIAQENGVPLYEDPDLAALLSRLDLGEAIPETLYRVIAEILAYSFYLQGFTPEDFQDGRRKG
ncbi:EscU/YscU/HrcU family type III secretion system export apparatus switch protein [Halospina sp. K52047b]|uniref:EscU/YscU/HrcU family type III secretion system export apparatus switch protein n=1 Tax=Halospina sp. K52047b TaxID=2614160 RepID=UPI00124A5C30|nr:EscU/YscU/HrcU family type III secretion system export apparatus switch protein [Halospina sp. K52047b]KAA8984260.1 flagellar protein FhlB [Halospina sp. K52047b]